MKFVVLGTSEFTLRLAQAVLDSGCEVAALVSIPAHALPLNSADIAGFARKRGIAYHEIEDINSEASRNILRGFGADFFFSSWPKMMKKEVFSIPSRFTIGSHPTELPYNRGRHPLHWLISLGIQKSTLSFFLMDEAPDNGRILLQYPFPIAENEVIGPLAAKMNEAAYQGALRLCRRLREDARYNGVEQNQSLATTWRKKTPHDVTLDLRMSRDAIARTVRSFSPPYPAAILIFEKHLLRIVSAAPARTDLKLEDVQRMEPGKIRSVEGRLIRVKAEDGLIDLECLEEVPASLLKAKYIHPPAKYLCDFSAELTARLAAL